MEILSFFSVAIYIVFINYLSNFVNVVIYTVGFTKYLSSFVQCCRLSCCFYQLSITLCQCCCLNYFFLSTIYEALSVSLFLLIVYKRSSVLLFKLSFLPIIYEALTVLFYLSCCFFQLFIKLC